VTTPEIFDALKHVRWSSFHSWWQFHNLFAVFGGSLAEATRRWGKRRNARLAQNWPSVDGRVQNRNVAKGTRFYGSAPNPIASFTYSYSVQEGSETNYYTGDFSRTFPGQDRAWEWLWTLKAAVLAGDLDAHFPLPVGASRFRRDRLRLRRHVRVWAPVIACKNKVANDNLALAA
jgi:hypothetical protein